MKQFLDLIDARNNWPIEAQSKRSIQKPPRSATLGDAGNGGNHHLESFDWMIGRVSSVEDSQESQIENHSQGPQ